MEDVLYDDFMSSDIPAVAILCKLSCFLRLLEELLLQCHEMAVAVATFSQADDFDYMSSDSDGVSMIIVLLLRELNCLFVHAG